MQTTLFGPVADALGAITQTEPIQGPYGTWERHTYSASPSTMYRRMQARVPVRVDHQGPDLGHLEHLELWPDKQLIATALVNLPDDINPDDGTWRWSPTIRTNGDTGIIDIFELSLTQQPGSIALRAVRALPGNLRFARDRTAWDLPASLNRMFERAAATDRDWPIQVCTDTTTPRTTTRASTPSHAEPASGPDYNRRNIRGPIMHGPRCPVLAVH